MQPNAYICVMKLLKTILFSIIVGSCFSQNANDIVLNAAKDKIGTKVWSGGCFDLVDYSLRCADVSWEKRSDKKHVYGRRVRFEDVMPGDIVLYENCVFSYGRTVKSHVAIVYSIIDRDSGTMEVLEQNTKRSLRESVVVVSTKNNNPDLLVNGKIQFYRPIPE